MFKVTFDNPWIFISSKISHHTKTVLPAVGGEEDTLCKPIDDTLYMNQYLVVKITIYNYNSAAIATWFYDKIPTIIYVN